MWVGIYMISARAPLVYMMAVLYSVGAHRADFREGLLARRF